MSRPWWQLVLHLAQKQTADIEQVDVRERLDFWIDRPRNYSGGPR